MRNVIGLCDCNNFYVSCERVFDPRLEGKPVGVLSNNDGCVIARSQEIKDLGVSMGAPAFEIPTHIKKKIVLRSSNYALYGDMSGRVTSTLRDNCPNIEVYSIDESFLFWEGFELKEIISRNKTLRRIVKRNTGIPVSIGLSTSRTLAKIANHRAKKDKSLGGVYWLDPDSDETTSLLSSLPVDEIWGVSRRLKERLTLMGIHTAMDLRNADPKHIRSRFSVVQEKLVYELRGHDCIETANLEPKKNIMTSRSFGTATSDRREVEEAVRVHAQHGAEKLRKQNSEAQGIMVFLKTNKHRHDLPQYHPSLIVPLVSPSNDTSHILNAAKTGLGKIWLDGYRYMKAGVMMLDLVDVHSAPNDLFEEQDTATKAKRASLMAMIDKINGKSGRDTVSFGGMRKKAAWHLKSEHRSNRYTTRWNELPEAKIK